MPVVTGSIPGPRAAHPVERWRFGLAGGSTGLRSRIAGRSHRPGVPIPGLDKGAPPGRWERSRGSSVARHLILEGGEREPVLVAGGNVADPGLRLPQLGLAQLHDRAQPQTVAGFREVESLAGLVQKLPGHVQATVGRVRVQPARAYVPAHPVADLYHPLLGGGRPQVGLARAGNEEKVVEDGDLDVDADRPVPLREVLVADGGDADRAHGPDTRPQEVVLGPAELLRRLVGEVEGQDLRPPLPGPGERGPPAAGGWG